jgi:hypothetical protein
LQGQAAAIDPFPGVGKQGGLVNAVVNSRNGLVKGILLAAIVTLAGSAFAGSKASMELLHPASVGGTQLPAGSYTLQWDGQGDQIQLQIFRGKKSVATTSARVVKVDSPVRDNSVIVVPSNDGGRSVSRINLAKKDFALDLETEGAGSGAAAGAAK